MRYRLTLLAMLLVCALVLASCAERTALSGTSWHLERLTVHGNNVQLVPTARVTLQFQSDTATYVGSSGCNYYSGAYTLSDHQLHLQFKDITATACVGPIMSQEVAYLDAMGQVDSYQVNGHVLTLRDVTGRVILVFDAS